MARKVRRTLAVAALAAAAGLAVAGCASSSAGTTPKNDSPGLVMINTSPYRGNPITNVSKPAGVLTDDTGQAYNMRTMTKGTVTLLFFGYTHCPDECPLTMSNVAAALRIMPAAQAAKVTVLFVTVDPQRDTLARLRSWLGNFDQKFIGLRGTLPQVAAFETQTGLPIGQEIKLPGGGYQLDHATEMFAYSTDNIAHLAFFPDTSPNDMAHDLKLLVTGHHP
jgi:protein SCO1/2